MSTTLTQANPVVPDSVPATTAAAPAPAPAPFEVAAAQPPPPQASRHALGSLQLQAVAAARAARRPSRASGLAVLVRLAAWTYFLAVLAVWVVMRLAGERWWAATMLLFVPRWNFAVPLGMLATAALFSRGGWRALPVLAASGGVVAFPIMDVRVPWRDLANRATAAVHGEPPAAAAPSGPTLRLLTCNVHGVELDAAALERYISESHADVVCLQGWLPRHRAGVFPAGAGWHVSQNGQLCVASRRFAVARLATIVPPSRDDNGMSGAFAIRAPEVLGGPGGMIRLIDVHIDSPHRAFAAALCAVPGAAEMIEANTLRRLAHARAIGRYLNSAAAPSATTSTILAGDFNMPSDSSVYQSVFDGTGAERWINAFVSVGWGTGDTYFGGGTTARIDHVLSEETRWRCVRCEVGPSVGSPHRPVVAELQWLGGHGDARPADRAVVVDVSR